jgi:hypothetical protein
VLLMALALVDARFCRRGGGGRGDADQGGGEGETDTHVTSPRDRTCPGALTARPASPFAAEIVRKRTGRTTMNTLSW